MHVQDIYETVTNQIVTALEKGDLPAWRKPWSGSGAFLPLRHGGQPYRGANVIILWIQSQIMGYSSPYYLTFKQALAYGGCVKKGEKSTAIIWCEPHKKSDTADDGTETDTHFWISKIFRVFNVDQCDGLPERFTAEAVPTLDPEQRIEHADTFIKNTKADIRHGNGEAFYRPSEDFINLPAFESFSTPEGYVGTALHELGHWSGHQTRLNRDLKGICNRQAYSDEEIRVELASAMLGAQLGIAPPDLGQHAAYIDFWIEAMKASPKYLFTAAGKAQIICDYLNGLQPPI